MRKQHLAKITVNLFIAVTVNNGYRNIPKRKPLQIRTKAFMTNKRNQRRLRVDDRMPRLFGKHIAVTR